jgi:hypothetical protein
MVAAMTTISVTAEHIARGAPECEWGCPVALAILDAVPGIAAIAVNGGYVGTADIRLHDGRVLELQLPEEARLFISDFDGLDEPQATIQPFTFDLDYPEVTP